MNRTIACILTAGLSAALIPSAVAQGTQADYERALSLARLTANRVFKSRVTPHWQDGGGAFWYRNELKDGRREYVFVDAVKGEKRPAFDHTRLAAALNEKLKKPVQADRLDLSSLRFDPKGSGFSFTMDGSRWECTLPRYALQERGKDNASQPSLPRLPRVRPSRRTGDDTSITFVNQTENKVDIFWIETEDSRRKYVTLAPGQEHVQHTYAGHVWLATDATGKNLGVFEATESGGRAVIDGKEPPPGREATQRPVTGNRPDAARSEWQPLIKDHNVYLRHRTSSEEVQLSRDGKEGDAYTGRLYHSPDGKYLVVLRTRKPDERKVTLVESSPRDQLQPRVHTLNYLKPGDQVAISKPHLFNLKDRKEVPVADSLFPNPWSIDDIRWQPDSKRFTFLYNQRGHQVLRLIAVDAATGEANAIIDEQSKTFIDYAHKRYIHYFDDTREALWMSERDGWNHLYLYDLDTGKVKSQVTKGPWLVRGVDRVDAGKRQVWFRAGGNFPDQDPYFLHHGRINLDGTGLVWLTAGDGSHQVEYSPDGKYLLDSYSRVDLPPVTELRSVEDGTLICELERTDWSELLRTGWRPPERFAAKGRDGQTDIYGVIFRPTTFDDKKQYPVIEAIYAGPQGAFVPKRFQAYHRQQQLAELGFIVVQIDGMGTSHRSKAFHDVCWKNLADAGFPDRIAWMKAAAAKYPCMDLSRVGIYGGSAGGQNALAALLWHPDFYKAAASDCGCHDNRMDKIWWNELWMGWPVGPHYEQQSNVTQAHRLKGKLLLTVGELDRNVDPASTLQVVDALVRANKDFDFILIPGGGHGAGESPYGVRRRMDFFVRHLLGVEPRGKP